jgi:probable phosphoglycerate mutase
VHLNSLGQEQAEHLAERVSRLPIEAVFSGPLERVQETAAPIARRFNLQVQTAEEFTEFDTGEWTNRSFTELAEIPLWRQFNSFRSATRPPGGELMLEVQVRVLQKMREIREQHQFVAIVTHGDVIRAAAAHFLGMQLDLFLRIEFDPASLSIIEWGDDFAHVRLLNAPGEGSALVLPASRHQ